MCMPPPAFPGGWWVVADGCTTRFSARLEQQPWARLFEIQLPASILIFCATWGILLHFPLRLFLLAPVLSSLLAFFSAFLRCFCLCCSSPSACFLFSSFRCALVVVSGIKKMAVLTNTPDVHTYVIMRVAAETSRWKSGRREVLWVAKWAEDLVFELSWRWARDVCESKRFW